MDRSLMGRVTETVCRLALATAAAAFLGMATEVAIAKSGNATIDQTWAIAEICRKKSFEAYPDHTQKAEEQRKKFVKNCEISRNYPGRPLILDK